MSIAVLRCETIDVRSATVFSVRLIATSKLLVTCEQSAMLLATMVRVNEARTWLAAEAMALPVCDRKSKFALQKAFYAALRARFGLPSQMAVRALANVAACFKTAPTAQHEFRDKAAVTYDDRILAFKGTANVTPTSVTLTTLDGRLAIPIAAGGPHHGRLAGERGESDLVLRKGRWYLHTSVTLPDVPAVVLDDYLGVDLGIINLATDSDGERYCGAAVEATRQRILTLRSALQKCDSRSARKHLKKLSGREARFRKDTNHVIAKRIVNKAKVTGRGIALEDLKGIRDRVTVRKGQRAQHGSWAFFQLRTFITYKAGLAGVPVVPVDPRNTSRTCTECDYCAKRNRRSQSEFVCKSCGFADHADHVASVNIARRASVNAPIVSSADTGNVRAYGAESRSSSDASLALSARGS